jgi:hypothetical protein
MIRRVSIFGAAALATLLGSALPAYPAASPDCFKVCSKLFYKHLGAVMTCAAKENEAPGKGVSCATAAATKMTKKYVIKLQSKCGGVSCLASYPATGSSTCLELVAAVGDLPAQNLFGYAAGPADFFTVNAIGYAAAGCDY